MKRELMRLRVPPGWTVSYNRFVEFTTPPTADEVFSELNQDLLQMNAGPQSHSIDLGWYPHGERDGAYGLQVLLPDFSGVLIVRVDHRDQYVIREALEVCAAAITGRGSAEQIAAAARAVVSP